MFHPDMIDRDNPVEATVQAGVDHAFASLVTSVLTLGNVNEIIDRAIDGAVEDLSSDLAEL